MTARLGEFGEPPSDPPVLIVGMHNSGTSILAEILHEAGVFVCPDMAHFECRYFTHFLHDDLLLGSRKSWSQLPLMPVEELLQKAPAVQLLASRMWFPDYLRSGYDGVSAWGLKDPRLCILLPLYLELFPGARVVYIKRDIDDLCASLLKRPKSGLGIKTDIAFWRELASAYTERADEFVPQFSNHVVLRYEDLCTSPAVTIQPVLDFLEVEKRAGSLVTLNKVTSDRIGSHADLLASGFRSRAVRETRRVAYRLLRQGNIDN